MTQEGPGNYRQKEVREEILGRAGRYQEVADNLGIKEVWVKGRRYIVCHNPQEAARDAANREAIVEAPEDQLREEAKQVGVAIPLPVRPASTAVPGN